MTKELKQLMIACKVSLLILWPASAWAATLAFGEQMARIPLLSIIVTIILSTVLGVAAMLHAMIDEYEKHDKIQHLWLFISSRLISSNAAGLLMFSIVDGMDIIAGYKAGAIMLAAFSGNWGIQRLLQFFANKYAPGATQ